MVFDSVWAVSPPLSHENGLFGKENGFSWSKCSLWSSCGGKRPAQSHKHQRAGHFLACFPLEHPSASIHERWWLHTNNHRISGVSPPNAALQFRWKRAAQDSIVEPSRGWHLWKCYYFVTKAAHFADHFNTPATESSISMPAIILLEQAPHFKRWISHCEMKPFRGRTRYLLWLHLNVKQLRQLSDYSVTMQRLEKSLFPLLVLTPGHQGGGGATLTDTEVTPSWIQAGNMFSSRERIETFHFEAFNTFHSFFCLLLVADEEKEMTKYSKTKQMFFHLSAHFTPSVFNILCVTCLGSIQVVQQTVWVQALCFLPPWWSTPVSHYSLGPSSGHRSASVSLFVIKCSRLSSSISSRFFTWLCLLALLPTPRLDSFVSSVKTFTIWTLPRILVWLPTAGCLKFILKPFITCSHQYGSTV